MAWTIDKIEIENFKFFKDSFQLDVNGKHILLYGENGSGKSSIFWSLYTLFQSALKGPSDRPQKYFMAGDPENLRNKYSKDTDDSGIRVTFSDTNTTLSVEDSSTALSVLTPSTKVFLERTMNSSDFLNYKFLSSIFDFKNSEENNVFDIFEKEIFPFLSLRSTLIRFDGTNTGLNDAATWWKHIRDDYQSLPTNVKNTKSFNMASSEYKAFNTIIDTFNRELNDALILIQLATNTRIKNDFGIDAEIKIDYTPAEFNKKVSARSRDKKVTYPKITLRASMTHPNVVSRATIDHPKSFFNEAKLTCMALSLRLAILDRRPSSGTSYNSSLFIDDLLISLDMGYRRKVIELLLSYSSSRQIFIFTHDRSFYYLLQSRVLSGSDKNNWKCYELYSNHVRGSEAPHLFETKSALDEARIHLINFEIPACVNALRRACEKELKRLLPFYMQLEIDGQGGTGLLNLNGLLSKYKDFRAYYKLPDIAPTLNDDRKLLLNPFSHDDIDTPFYRNDVEITMNELMELSSINRIILVNDNSVRRDTYRMTITNGTYVISADFKFDAKYTKLQYRGVNYWGNPGVLDVVCSKPSIKNRYQGIRAFFHDMMNAVSLNNSTVGDIDTYITEIKSGRLLSSF